ncbi:thymidine phosphorylase [Pseudosulfitobacter pseudonitzschiae]|uniref:thymidine phosphorylase n=1 Tax=Pseudosulfitobacter pseudonitzschiae TaxID=1402135 RepID=UPI001AF5A9FA|nr:thymidine phosphorylase [Pseudosulfitobacter pseudonitzschiae]MBM1814071.1 thymidine phosphorylase [Pseudosulfitobacter pseudonitzschiae]MBM1831064.1 thymidine phosphorylase [Pseudosulfitobacter pseudonitzschiae]MBM1835931.1 thymidine phosphorylase [Pseudosulfitobacter pseudonitzschiae]MBM1840777.1 thymidine phosphorylase [Pseudosulfitobacter pseudonitzschiae]MBM1845235.1 thymidine phosphorylase [Pseudosulfitobacter pseudonitzschiae]
MSDFSARDIIATLRAGDTPPRDALAWFAQGLADGAVSDAQAGAFAMAVCLNGLSDEGRVALTLAMRDSGQVLNWDLDGPVLDKHSTGGVGDCVSLVLAPALAACGAFVPMISGRGLGHTGGTLDKLEAIPGVNVNLDAAQFHDVVAGAGCAIVGATGDIAPADKRLYAIRDVTATVESLDLITASILSKKLAGGLEGLVLDVKVGSGAFMKDMTAARALAEALTQTANAAGCRTSALITDMNQPLAPSLGNALEVSEVMAVLTAGEGDAPLSQISAALGGVLLADAGLAADAEAGAARIADMIRSGHAAERFGKMIAAMGGPVQFVENHARFLPEATVIREVATPRAGVVRAIDGEALGRVVVSLGGGRAVESDVVDPAVGLSRVLRLGDTVAKGQPLAVIHAARPDQADRAEAAVRAAFTVGDRALKAPALIHARMS